MKKKGKVLLGIGAAAATVAGIFAFKNRKKIKEKLNEKKDKKADKKAK